MENKCVTAMLLLVAFAGAIGTASAQNGILVEETSVTVVPAGQCSTQWYVNKTDNWFLQMGAGIALPLVENRMPDGKAERHITATYNLGVGRWFSPYMGFRFSGYYGAMHWDNDSYSRARVGNLNFDMMWDMCNSLFGVKPTRVFSVVPFVGVGGAYVWNIRSEGTNVVNDDGTTKHRSWTIPVSAGMQFRFRLCPYADFFIEGRATFYGDNFNGAVYGRPIDITIQATSGFSFNLGGVKVHSYNTCNNNSAQVHMLNNQVNSLRADLAATAAALAVAQSQLPCPDVETQNYTTDATVAPLMSTVRFTINSCQISDEEMVNVYNTAEYLKENPSVDVIIKGYADKDTGTEAFNMELSRKRAQAVYDALTNMYGIDGGRLVVDAEGSNTQPYDVNNWNRIVIFVPAF